MLLHPALLNTAANRYPEGVNVMRCDHLAAAIAVPHLKPSLMDRAVWGLTQSDVLGAFAGLGNGPGGRAVNVVEGVRRRGVRLSNLRYRLAQDAPE